MAEPPINIGVIGCGQIAQNIHLKILPRLPGVRVTALAEADAANRERARALAPGATLFESADELIHNAQVEAVLIALPSALHAQTAITALAAGKHVYLEKPVATKRADARRVVEAWQTTKMVGMIGFNYRFNPLIQQAKTILGSGLIGDLLAIQSVFSAAAHSLPEWKRNRITGGGVLLDLGSHHVDQVQYLTGQPIDQVFARTSSVRGEADNAALEMRLAGGALVQSFFSLSAIDEDRIDLYGTRATLSVDRHRGWSAEVDNSARQGSRFDGIMRGLGRMAHIGYAIDKFRAVGHERSYQAALECFVRAVRGEAVEYPNLEAGYRSLCVIEAAEKAAIHGASVAISEINSVV